MYPMTYPDFHSKGAPACKTVEDPEIFFPDPYGKGSGSISARAKNVCITSKCAYLEECLSWALENNEPGVWGGTSENERRKMKRKAAGRPVPVTLYLSRPQPLPAEP